MRLFRATIVAALACALPPSMAYAQAADAAPAAQETSIPFIDMGGIRDWQAIDDNALYVQDVARKWYLAKLMGPCTDLSFATTIGFETKGVNRLDRFGAVVVNGQRCPLTSFVASDGPPRKAKMAQ